jgi:hypothetical protein
MGKQDPQLWNWIHVTAPANATVEHVAHTPLFGDHIQDGSEQAYRIAASPPYFGIPFETAKRVPEAFGAAPEDVKQRLAHGEGPRFADSSPLAKSTASDEAALAQAPGARKGDLPLDHALERVDHQLAFLQRELGPWKLADRLAGASAFADRRRAELRSDRRTANKWTNAVAQQERTLFAVSSDIAELIRGFSERGATPDHAAQLSPYVRVLDAYAHAAGASHVAAQGEGALAEARRQRDLLPMALVEDQIRVARTLARDQHDAEQSSGIAVSDDATMQLAGRAADLRLRAARGGQVDPQQFDQLAVDVQEAQLKTRLRTIQIQLAFIEKKADEEGETTQLAEQGLPTVRALPAAVHPKVNKWLDQLDKANQFRGPQSGLSSDQTLLHQKQQAVGQVSFALDELASKAEIQQWFAWAEKHLQNRAFWNAVASIALQIGIMVVTGEIAGAAVAAVRGTALIGRLLVEVREASLLFRGAELGIHAGLATVAQGAMGGPMDGRAFAENAVGIFVSEAALRPFGGLLEDSAALDADLRTLAQRALKTAGSFGADLAAGAAGSTVGHAVTHGELSATSADELVVQGISLAASRFVGQRTAHMRERIEDAMRKAPDKQPFEALLTEVDALSQRVQKNGTAKSEEPELARELLTEGHQLIVEEGALYKQAGITGSAAKANARDQSIGPAFADVPLILSKLKPVIEGEVYEGTPSDIEAALKNASQMGLDLKAVRDPDTGVVQIAVGGRRIDIYQTGGEIIRHKQRGDGDRAYPYDKMHPGPLSYPGMSPNDTPAAGFFGGQYEEIVLDSDRTYYRVASAREADGGPSKLGRWYTEQPLQSDMQLRMDTAVKPVWQDKDGRITGTSLSEMAIVVRVPKGTKVYRGPVAAQGMAHLGGPGTIQVLIPDIRATPGVQVVSTAPFKPHGADPEHASGAHSEGHESTMPTKGSK